MSGGAHVLKQVGHFPAHIPDRLSTIIKKFAQESKSLLPDEIISEHLFGSYATNTFTSLSDIDILILVNKFSLDIRRKMSGLASDFSLEYDVFISPIIKDRQVWEKNKQHHTLFYQDVTEHGISL